MEERKKKRETVFVCACIKRDGERRARERWVEKAGLGTFQLLSMQTTKAKSTRD